MEGEFIRTKDHETIRGWIEAHNGAPVAVTDVDGMIIDIAFDEETRGFGEITWDEFFDWLDENHLTFEYTRVVPKGEEAFSYNFISDSTPSDTEDDETELAEDNEMGEENLHQEMGEI